MRYCHMSLLLFVEERHCKDKSWANCAYYRSINYCVSHRKTLRKRCRKSCLLCGKFCIHLYSLYICIQNHSFHICIKYTFLLSIHMYTIYICILYGTSSALALQALKSTITSFRVVIFIRLR